MMGAGDIASLAFGIIGTALSAAKQAGLLGKTDTVRYIEAGLYTAVQAGRILTDISTNPDRYDAMSPADVKALLMPPEWEDLEARARAELRP